MHSVIVQKRRKRSINFTDSDRHILLNLVQPHLAVIENKKLDKFTSKLKSETWENIKTQYNQLNTEPRTALQLKLFYEANKYRMRKVNKGSDNSTDESESKIVKIELETQTILDALAENEKLKSENENIANSSQEKIKCVKLEKLQNTKCIEGSVDLMPKALIMSEMEPASSLNHSSPCNSPVPNVYSATLSPTEITASKQNELHAMRIKILEDERLFRRQEHLKHMEYFEIGIMTLKAHLLKQTQQPTAALINRK